MVGGGDIKFTSAQQRPPSAFNSGLYAWSHDNVWVLQYTFFDPDANTRSAMPGDYVESYPARSNEEPVIASSFCDPVELEPVTVIAPFYGPSPAYVVVTTGAHSNLFQRIFRRPNVLRGSRDSDPNITCANSSEEDRMLAARETISQSTTPMSRRGIYTINYGPGTSQRWSVTDPYLTTLGLIPAGPCEGP